MPDVPEVPEFIQDDQGRWARTEGAGKRLWGLVWSGLVDGLALSSWVGFFLSDPEAHLYGRYPTKPTGWRACEAVLSAGVTSVPAA